MAGYFRTCGAAIGGLCGRRRNLSIHYGILRAEPFAYGRATLSP
jgi:hypothetical protein